MLLAACAPHSIVLRPRLRCRHPLALVAEIETFQDVFVGDEDEEPLRGLLPVALRRLPGSAPLLPQEVPAGARLVVLTRSVFTRKITPCGGNKLNFFFQKCVCFNETNYQMIKKNASRNKHTRLPNPQTKKWFLTSQNFYV